MQVPDLAEKKLIFFQDYVTMGIIIIDFLQFIGMGPDIRGYDEVSSLLADYATINYSWLTRGETFWIFVYSSLAAVLVWVYFSVYTIFEFRNFDNFLCNFSRNFAEFALPFIGNACFLPIISILLSVFQCDQAIGEDLSQSFVRNDCTVFCWKELHIFWAFLSIFALLIYIPLAIYFRLNWENQNSGINIKSRPCIWC
ncbi:unnamed protein product [Blepharisma stoltei]|uniref:Uncharacterized protein n=1 Tax=Blepharisma stoltei TaxID=1481888 RepID=A0AAU9I7A1_9CILI|nr:unnamed protein product [Blepharisma stoltei]